MASRVVETQPERPGEMGGLDQPDHRQRIPVTVVEQVSPDSVSFVLRNLVHDEDPGDFDASLGRTRTGSVQDDAKVRNISYLRSFATDATR